MNKQFSNVARHATRVAVAAALSATALIAAATPASAHATVQTYGEVAKKGSYGAVFIRIPHADADKTTQKIEVQIPEGVTAVKPQRVPGWVETTTKTADGKNVATVIWSGGDLPDTSFQDFGIQLKYPATSGTLYFKTVQTLNDGSTVGWIEIPAAGVHSHSLSKPAPSVNVIDPAATAAPASWKGDFSAVKAGKNYKLIVDTPATGYGKEVRVVLVKHTATVDLHKGKLDNRGDLFRTIMAKKTGKGSYEIASGDVIRLVIDGVTVAETKA